MIREMTLGQYYRADSILHRLDPRIKLMGTLVFAISLFLPKSVVGIICASLSLGIVLALSKVPLKYYLRGVKPLIPIIIFSAVMNIFFSGGTILWTWGFLRITKEGLWQAGFMMIRLIYLIVGTSVMTFTTTPKQLMDGMEKAFHFLTYVKVPVHELSMMMSIALRFIPILTEELDKIMKAQMSRGMDFEEGNFLVRAKKLLPLLIPLFISAIRRASDLALAMDARCYHGGDNRTKLHPLRYQKKDYAAYIIEGIYFIIMVLCSIFAGI